MRERRDPAWVRANAAKAACARRRPEAETKGMVSGGEGKGDGGDWTGGEWSSRAAQTGPDLASAAEFRVLAKPGQQAFFALPESG